VTHVLVIDDEAPIRLLCRVNLEAEGMDVSEAGDVRMGDVGEEPLSRRRAVARANVQMAPETARRLRELAREIFMRLVRQGLVALLQH